MAFNDLATMIAYFVEQQDKIKRVMAEVDEINQGITSELVEAQDRTEAAVADAVAIAHDGFGGLDVSARDSIEATLAATREAKTARRAELGKLIADLQTDRSEIEQKDTDESEKLAQENPTLNAGEEILKTKVAEAQAAIAQTEEQLRQAAAGLAWLTHARAIGRLRKQHQNQATALYGLRERLSEVRNLWAKHRAAARDEEDRLQQAWRLRTAEIAKLTQELDALTDDFEGVCRQSAIEGWVRAQETYAPTGVGDLDEALKQLVAARQHAADCESGVVAVSEILGVLKGVGDGMARMQTSIEGVKQEQDMHSELSTLKIEAPSDFLKFHELWDALMETVTDEKRSIEHPKAFADIVRNVIDTYLNNQNLELMFSMAGEVLNKATKEQWG
ncbi:MAG: hypothetical protein FJX75_03635 [Armatimonadetes bacterium]|nr:hypothetical protein [Armatimonadota bacterium]